MLNEAVSASVVYNQFVLKHTKGGYTGFGLFVIQSVHHNFFSAQYLENKLIETH